MLQPDVATKAKQLLSRRNSPNGVWYYLRRDLRRQAPFLMAYVAIPIALWSLDAKSIAIAAAGFFAGSKIRDIRWWASLSREWPTTTELLDWPKIEALAGTPNDSSST